MENTIRLYLERIELVGSPFFVCVKPTPIATLEFLCTHSKLNEQIPEYVIKLLCELYREDILCDAIIKTHDFFRQFDDQ